MEQSFITSIRLVAHPHPALQGLATSASGVTTGFVMFVAFTAASAMQTTD
jgi:hypothetical protein